MSKCDWQWNKFWLKRAQNKQRLNMNIREGWQVRGVRRQDRGGNHKILLVRIQIKNSQGWEVSMTNEVISSNMKMTRKTRMSKRMWQKNQSGRWTNRIKSWININKKETGRRLRKRLSEKGSRAIKKTHRKERGGVPYMWKTRRAW